MSTESFISFFSPFVFTGVAIYFSLFITKINSKVKSREVLFTWVAISTMYILMPLAVLIVNILPYASFILPAVVVFIFAKFYWKLKTDKAAIFAVCYGLVNVVAVMALGFLLSGAL